MPSDQALDRVARVLDLIPLLTAREMSISELAATLNVKPEVVERDLEVAFMCGLPGYTPDLLIDLRFDDGFVSVLDPQSLRDPRRLTDEEFNALRMGLEIIRPALEASPSLRTALGSLLTKLNETAPHAIESLDGSGPIARAWEIIDRALLLERRIRFNYVDSLGRVTHDRLLSPWRFSWLGGRVILSGFDHQKNEARNFFLARMKDLELTDEEITLNSDGSARSQRPLQVAIEAEVGLTDAPLWWRRRYSSYITDVRLEHGNVTVSLRYWSRDWLIMAISSITDRFTSLHDPTWSEAEFRESLKTHIAPSREPSDG
jgi:predicted DNA-binding transcriptional regulator YafY